MNYALVILSTAFIFSSWPIAIAEPNQDPSMQSETGNGIFEIATLSETATNKDLTPLNNTLTGARIIGLGEIIHTSGGFNQAKFRLAKFLVETAGVTTIVFEDNSSAFDPVNTFLTSNCEGTAGPYMSHMYKIFQSTINESMFNWLCSYNLGRLNPIQLTGFDIKQPYYYGQSIRQALIEFDEDIPDLDTCFGVQYRTASEYLDSPEYRDIYVEKIPLPNISHQKCLSALDEVAVLFESKSSASIENARISLIGLNYFQRMIYEANRDMIKASLLRDEGMAYVVREMKRTHFANGTMILWSNNHHLNRKREDGIDPQGNSVGKSLGSFLRDWYREEYKVIGYTGYRVFFNWPGVLPEMAELPEAGDSIELLLENIGPDILFVDPANNFIGHERFSMLDFPTSNLSTHYDGLFFLRESAPMEYCCEY